MQSRLEVLFLCCLSLVLVWHGPWVYFSLCSFKKKFICGIFENVLQISIKIKRFTVNLIECETFFIIFGFFHIQFAARVD
ncbi:hypothetical protein CDL12_20744 [Handroanthus impetiginosus]|uniref:Uncharacterized protein n=1 Tax=Handroanthus impetiginosus TaxID=429701 RepID=A0A2G9GNB3_9LAMI|nr:hypothetical protein CDL12_20744 [Handroanthus impetiginosus]